MVKFFFCLGLLWIGGVGVAGEAFAQQKRGEVQKPIPKDTTERQRVELPQSYEQASPYEQNIERSADLEIDGLIVDETITKVGRDFYEVFTREWEAPPAANNFTILIGEMPARGNTSIVSLSVNDQKIFEQALQPRYDVVEEIATYLAGAVYEYLLKDELNKQLEAEGKKAREVF